MPPDAHVTLGELVRQVHGLAGSVDRMGEQIAGLREKTAVDYIRLGALEERVKSLEEWKRWAVRIIVGGVVMAALALILK